jgi:hypothetical protein
MDARAGGAPGQPWRVSGFTTDDPKGSPDHPTVGIEFWVGPQRYHMAIPLSTEAARMIGHAMIDMADHAEETA